MKINFEILNTHINYGVTNIYLLAMRMCSMSGWVRKLKNTNYSNDPRQSD
ncbi:hypothetical protein VCHA51O444_10438 [Vibrio chagasii]|nr:hypothetical protein VCHA51O444_10438 [Vibrio chagasii]